MIITNIISDGMGTGLLGTTFFIHTGGLLVLLVFLGPTRSYCNSSGCIGLSPIAGDRLGSSTGEIGSPGIVDFVL